MVAVFVTHGAVFSALRMPREHRSRALPKEHRAGGATMFLLAVLAAATVVLGIAFPVLPILLAAQVWMWSMFRHRVGTGSAVFF